MKKNVFVAGVMMAAIAMVGCGTMMSSAVAPSMRVCAASAQSADDAVKQLIHTYFLSLCHKGVVPFDTSPLGHLWG